MSSELSGRRQRNRRGDEPSAIPFTYASIRGMDPGADWAFGPGLHAFLPPGASPNDVFFPFLIELHDQGAARVTAAFIREMRGEQRLFGLSGPIFVGPDARANDSEMLRPNVPYSMAFRPHLFADVARADQNTPVLAAFRTARKTILLSLPMRFREPRDE